MENVLGVKGTPDLIAPDRLYPRFRRSLQTQPSYTSLGFTDIMAEEKQIQEETTQRSHSLSHQPSRGLHHDHVAEEAIGGTTADLGKSYFTSVSFIGTVIVRCY